MTVQLRAPHPSEAPALSALCLRSKAYWGYDAAFMNACIPALTITPEMMAEDPMRVATRGETLAGLAQVAVEDDIGHLELLFIDPAHMGTSVGRRLFDWATQTLRADGAAEMVIESDPGAAAFYMRMGARPAGTARSGVFPDRELPRLVLAL